MASALSVYYPHRGIKPIINPFWAFTSYMVISHYFCYSLWPIIWWHIGVHFNLLDRMSGLEFLRFGSAFSFSTDIMLLFFLFAAGYNTTNTGATQQIYVPPRFFSWILFRLLKSMVLSIILISMVYTFFFWIEFNIFRPEQYSLYLREEHLEMQLPNLDLLASYIFTGFSTYYNIVSYGKFTLFAPFNLYSLIYVAGMYLFFLFVLINNKIPLFIVIAVINRHFWQRLNNMAKNVISTKQHNT